MLGELTPNTRKLEDLREPLTQSALASELREVLSVVGRVRRVLVIHPDYTRTDFTDRLFPELYRQLSEQGLERLDTLNAGGTHRGMGDQELRAKLGLVDTSAYPLMGTMYNHEFSDPSKLVTVGEIAGAFVSLQTQDQLREPIEVTVNRLVVDDYDLVVGISGVLPHEAAGYSGGLKVFFPGVSGPNVIDLLHWAAVLIGIPNIIGSVRNPAREVIEEGSRLIFESVSAPVLSLTMVFEESEEVVPRGLYSGWGLRGFREAYELATQASARLHVVELSEPVEAAVQVIGTAYDEIWTAGKGSYKLQMPGVMAPNGEVIIYAPHIRCFHSDATMDRALRAIGYHCLGYVLDYLRAHPVFSRNVAAHVVNVRGPGEWSDGVERCAFRVTLATGISKEECERVNLGYRAPASISPDEFCGRGRLWVSHGGKLLYARNP